MNNKKMKLYICSENVGNYDYSENYIHAVFDDEKIAKEFAEEVEEVIEVAEVQLNVKPPIHWNIRLDMNSSLVFCRKEISSEDYDSLSTKLNDGLLVKLRSADYDKESAIKKAKEILREMTCIVKSARICWKDELTNS